MLPPIMRFRESDMSKGVWLCMKYEILQMLKQGSGAIVNASFITGHSLSIDGGLVPNSAAGHLALTYC